MHETSDFYDLLGFRAGKSSLRPIERSELTDVAGRSLLHLLFSLQARKPGNA